MASTAPSSSSSGVGKKRQKKGQKQQEVTNVAESTRIRVAQVLEQFRVSNDEGIFELENYHFCSYFINPIYWFSCRFRVEKINTLLVVG